jgi:integrase
MFLRLSGMRVGEAISLKWEDIDFEKDRILIKNSKGKRLDEFPLYYGLKEFLVKFRQLSGKIFDFKDKDSTKFWNRALDDIEDLEGRKYTLHQIRKTFATQLVNKNVSVFDAMKLLRHKNINTTLKYYTYADLNRLGDEANKVFGKIGLLNGCYFCNDTPQTASNGVSKDSKKVLKLVKIKEK